MHKLGIVNGFTFALKPEITLSDRLGFIDAVIIDLHGIANITCSLENQFEAKNTR